MATTGRNDPCPCGSGKKYKRCCLGKEALRAAFSHELEAQGLPLLRELGRYAAQRAGARPETIAAERFPFWRPPLDRIRASRLLDFLIFDYRPASYGRNAASEYLAERGSVISARWRELLTVWQDVSMRLFVLEQWSGGFARCRPVLPDGGAAIDVMSLERPDTTIADESPIALRALPLGEFFVFGSWPVTFGNRSVDDVRESIIARHHAFVRRERIVSLEDFLRTEGTAFDEENAAGTSSQIIIPGRA
jgi:SEC-C motif